MNGNPQLKPIVSNNSTDSHNMSNDSETSSCKNALEAIIYNETMGDVLADPKIDPSLKAELDATENFIGTLKNWASPLLNRTKAPADTSDVETGLNAAINGINNSNPEQSETLKHDEIKKYQVQINQLMATNEQERKADKVRYKNLEKSYKEQLQAQFLEQQRLSTLIQYLTTQLITSQQSNQVNPQIIL